MNYRNLSVEEIARLQSHGCVCDDWSRVWVAEPFVAERYRGVQFAGDIHLGSADGEMVLADGYRARCGIYNAALQDCIVGNNVRISNVGQYILNYEIADGALVENVGVISCAPDATFGRDVDVNVLNETGGREVRLCEKLSAQVAYLMAMYRHDMPFVESLKRLVVNYNENCRRGSGLIGRGAQVVGVYSIRDVIVGECACINGAKSLENGTIVSSAESPTTVDVNVIARHFMALEGARLGCGALINHGFAGQSVEISNQFTVHDSLFFANTVVENGESAAAFAGPFTVSMHKSSLLIAGMYSFMNAGSGTNQSNHMYKLGPVHQGVLERGSKTASGSYVLLPARVGAFSLVQGHHSLHPDTTRLPFSYLIEENGTYSLVPGVSLKSCGTIRDAQKWRKRDRRRGAKLDNITFDMLNPYTVGRAMDGRDLLEYMLSMGDQLFDGYTISESAQKKGMIYYQLAVDKFMGRAIVERLLRADSFETFKAQGVDGVDYVDWIDVCGQLMPRIEMEHIIEGVKNGTVSTLDTLLSQLNAVAGRYEENVWRWVCYNIDRWWDMSFDDLTLYDINNMVDRWCEAVVSLDQLIKADARKEFSEESQVSFGIDGDEETAIDDFSNSRGEYEKNAFVQMVVTHIQQTEAKCAEVKEKIANWG